MVPEGLLRGIGRPCVDLYFCVAARLFESRVDARIRKSGYTCSWTQAALTSAIGM